jgi:DNA polymerase-1
VATWQNLTVSRARANGYTQTITGRKRQLPNINSVDRFLRTEAERIAINTRIQGSAADIIKIAMRNFIRERTARGYTSEDMRFIGQVHDEVLLEVKDQLVDEARELLKSTMERSVLLAVPLIAEPVVVSSWGDAK